MNNRHSFTSDRFDPSFGHEHDQDYLKNNSNNGDRLPPHSPSPNQNDSQYASSQHVQQQAPNQAHARNTHYKHVQKVSRRGFYILALVIGFIIVITTGVFLFKNNNDAQHEIPVVKADSKPFKVRAPLEETVIPHSEKTIYAELGAGEAVNKVENLLDDPEKPQTQMPSLPDDFMASLNEIDNSDTGTTIAKEDVSMTSPSTVAVSPSTDQIKTLVHNLESQDNKTSSLTAQSSESVNTSLSSSAFEDVTAFDESQPHQDHAIQQSSTPSHNFDLSAIPPSLDDKNNPSAQEISQLKVKSSKLTAPKNTKDSPPVDLYRIQLYSGLSHKNVHTYWKTLKQKSGGLLASYAPVIKKVDLGSVKGIHYRLQFGEFSKKEAFGLCSKLREHSIDCWPVKP